MASESQRLQYEMSKLVTTHDMKLNFRALSDLMFVKFQQLEDMKMGLRDTLVF